MLDNSLFIRLSLIPIVSGRKEDGMLTVKLENTSDKVVLNCRGRIVLGEETRLMCAALPHHGREIIVDLSEVTAIDAAGVGALMALQAAGIYCRLVNPSEHVREVLRLTHLDSIVEICGPTPLQLGHTEVASGSLACCFATGD